MNTIHVKLDARSYDVHTGANLLARAGDAGLVDAALARRVADAYREFRQLQHSMRLNDAQYARVDPESVAALRADVRALWKAVLEP